MRHNGLPRPVRTLCGVDRPPRRLVAVPFFFWGLIFCLVLAICCHDQSIHWGGPPIHAFRTRILTPMFDVGVMDAPAGSWSWKKLSTNCTTAASVASARHLSAVSTVLLKNDGGVLPLPLSVRQLVIVCCDGVL